jgi:hypothetical protein
MSKPKPAESDWELRQRLTATLALRSQRSLQRIPQAPHWPRRDLAVRTSRTWVPADAQSSTKWRKAAMARASDRSVQVPQLGDSLGSVESMKEMSREFWGTQNAFVQPPLPELLSSAEVRFSPRPISGIGGRWVAAEMGRRTPRAPSTPRSGSHRLTPMAPRSGATPPPGAKKPSVVSPRSVTALMRGESTVRAIVPFHTPFEAETRLH